MLVFVASTEAKALGEQYREATMKELVGSASVSNLVNAECAETLQ